MLTGHPHVRLTCPVGRRRFTEAINALCGAVDSGQVRHIERADLEWLIRQCEYSDFHEEAALVRALLGQATAVRA